MKRRRAQIIGAMAKGLIIAVAITLAGMLAMAAAVVFLGMSDTLIRALNQALKVIAAASGTYLAVRRGGERGFLTGAGVGAVYSVTGYALYAFLGDNDFYLTELMGEMSICMAAGAVMGAICANLRPARRLK